MSFREHNILSKTARKGNSVSNIACFNINKKYAGLARSVVSVCQAYD